MALRHLEVGAEGEGTLARVAGGGVLQGVLPPAAATETCAYKLRVSGHPPIASPGVVKQVGFNLSISRAPECLGKALS